MPPLVLESIERISANKLGAVNTMLGAQDAVVKDLVQCGYVGAADQVDRYGNASTTLNPDLDTAIVGTVRHFYHRRVSGRFQFPGHRRRHEDGRQRLCRRRHD